MKKMTIYMITSNITLDLEEHEIDSTIEKISNNKFVKILQNGKMFVIINSNNIEYISIGDVI